MALEREPDSEAVFDLVVVGGGMGGLAAAALAQRVGMRTALLESHTKLGGCAGYFRRKTYTFDAGATALIGVDRGEPLGDLMAVLGSRFQPEPATGYRVHLPDRDFEMVAEPRPFEQSALATFATADGPERARHRLFWRLQELLGEALFRSAARVPRLPVRTLGDLVHDVRILGPIGLMAGATALLTVRDVLRILGLSRNRSFCSLIDILLEDTAQGDQSIVPFANAAACIQAYRRGMRRPRGGMRTLVEDIGDRFAMLGGDLRTGCLVDRVESVPELGGPIPDARGSRRGGFAVITRRRQRLLTRQIALNLPLDLAARLLQRPLVGRLSRREIQSRASWSAFTGYVAIDRDAVADSTPLFHQVLRSYDAVTHDGNNVLVSLSPVGDQGYGPANVRVATMSTHTRPADWHDLHGDAYQGKKAEFRGRLLEALGRALPRAPAALLHEEFASPRSFERYTRRVAGTVGGAPVTRSNSNFLAVDSDVFGPGVWIVGDSVFPGQGTMATTLSAIRVVERITGVSWESLRHRALDPRTHTIEPKPDAHAGQGLEGDDDLVSRARSL